MADLVLTAERRSELAALLDDEPRLRAEHPKVLEYLEYLEMRPALAGTGNSSADADFDVRFVHFMSGGESVSANPYWEIVASSVFEHEGRRVVNGGDAQGSPRLAFAQMILQAAYAYAIPSPESVEWMSQFCGNRSVVELGAGRGYWARQLSRVDVDVAAYELEPPDKGENVSFPSASGQCDVWYSVRSLAELRLDGLSNHVLFLCWPPGWGNPMASGALAAFEAAGGNRLVYIGEPRGGKTADDAFFEALAANWTLESTDLRFVSWWNLNDLAQGWVRR